MKTISAAFALFLSVTINAQHSLEPLWKTDSLLKTPESVLFSGPDKVLYVSIINGDPVAKDGNGSIGKVGLDGKIINAEWVKGLDAPKGLGLYRNTLYAADLNNVAVIDAKKAAVIQKIEVKGSGMLNDITVDRNGIIYVSDSQDGKIFRIENGKPALFLENIKGVNGLYSYGPDLYILADGKLLKTNEGKKLTKLADGFDPSTDGLEMVKEKEFLVSCWSGIVYYVKTDGSNQVLLDTRDKKINSADIGYNPQERIVYVPTFNRKSVNAYKLK